MSNTTPDNPEHPVTRRELRALVRGMAAAHFATALALFILLILVIKH
ncbi:hypothetical protein ACFYZ9_33655 [Streptomyces sp. NPDC001691]